MQSYTEQRSNLTNSVGLNQRNVRVRYLRRSGTDGPKPHPLVERPYSRHEYVWVPYTGSVRQLVNDNRFVTHSGSFPPSSFNMGYYKGKWNPNLDLSTYVVLHNGDYLRFDGGSPSFGVNPDLLSQAEVKALNGLRNRSGQNEPDLGLFWAERRETAEMFRDAAVGLSRLASRIARKDVPGTVRVLKDIFSVPATHAGEAKRLARVERRLRRAASRKGLAAAGKFAAESFSNAWLGYNLGLSPLMRDLDSAYTRLQTGDLTTKLTVTSKARYGKPAKPFDWSQTIENYTGKVEQRQFGTVEDSYQVILRAVPVSSSQATLSRLGLANPANLAYQATSLTFVLDYWLAIGPFLSSLSVPMEFEWVDGSWSHHVVASCTATVTSPDGLLRSRGIYRGFDRHPYSKFPAPIPPLSLRTRDLSDKQIVNVGLLAIQKLRGILHL